MNAIDSVLGAIAWFIFGMLICSKKSDCEHKGKYIGAKLGEKPKIHTYCFSPKYCSGELRCPKK